MFYCPKCLNIYNITKSIHKDQLGGGLDNIIKQIINKEPIDDDIKITEDDLDKLSKLDSYKKLQNKQKDLVYNTLSEKVKRIPPKDKESKHIQQMYFICKNCGNTETIKEGTNIISRTSNTDSIKEDSFNAKEYLAMNILPHTRQYNCINDKCESHKIPEKKSAVFMRLHNSYKIRYICETCESAWII